MLDVVGQCTPSPPTKAGGKGKAPAVLAGCGALDAHTIRTNCCALISLLASAVLATAPVTTTSGNIPSAGGEENLSLEGYANKAGGNTSDTGLEGGGGGGWDTFLPMGAKPSPDVVCLVRKKGWAARQQQEQQQLQRPRLSSGGGAAAGDSLQSRVPGTYGRIKKHRTRQKARAGGSDDSGSPVRQAAESGASKRNRRSDLAAGSPGKRLNERHQTRTGLDTTQSNGTNASKNNRLGGDEGRRIDKTVDRALSRQCVLPPKEDRTANVEGKPALSRQHLPMSDCLASPPRLSRAREGGIPVLPSGWSSPAARRLDGVASLGLSTPGAGNRKSTAKVGSSRVWATP